MIELTSRTSGASEMPSSASRSSPSPSLNGGLGDGVLDEGRVQRPGGARQALDLGQDVGARGDEELDRMARRESELVEALHVLRIGDRDLQRAVLERERDRADTLQHRQRDELAGVRVDAGFGEVDQRQVVLLGERAGDALGGGEPLVAERLRERASGRPRANVLELVRLQEARLADQFGDELAPLAAFRLSGLFFPGGLAFDEAELGALVVHSRGLHVTAS